MNKIKSLIFTLIVILPVSSCLKEKREATYNSQEDKIDKYISTNMYKKTGDITDTLRVEYRGGASRLVITEGNGEKLKADGMVSLYYAGYTFTGNKSSNNLFITNHKETAEGAKWALTDESFELKLIDMADTELLKGLKEGLVGVQSGEHCEILFSGKYGFGKKPFGIIPANSALLFEIWVEAVSND
jgi:FKBP-type peptidyl-prolyl cis-trans isomerase